MEAASAIELPVGPEWQYEPKWDGFRCLAFRDRNNIRLISKSGKTLSRYFPELIAALSKLKLQHFVIDGEIVLPIHDALSFDHLLMRIHPSVGRITKLSQETPCVFLVFDLLVDNYGKSLVKLPLQGRRTQLENQHIPLRSARFSDLFQAHWTGIRGLRIGGTHSQLVRNVADRQRLAEKVALNFIAMMCPEERQLRFVFDTFGNYLEA
jgi:ATP-dependent DNA ligase